MPEMQNKGIDFYAVYRINLLPHCLTNVGTSSSSQHQDILGLNQSVWETVVIVSHGQELRQFDYRFEFEPIGIGLDFIYASEGLLKSVIAHD